MLLRTYLLAVMTLWVLCTHAQPQPDSIAHVLQKHIHNLASNDMKGRGYVQKGQKKAANYIGKQLRSMGLQTLPDMSNMQQQYEISVNTFPGKVKVTINGKELIPGKDYLVDAASSSYHSHPKRIQTIDLATITDTQTWMHTKAALSDTCIWLLKNVDSMCKNTDMTQIQLKAQLPKGCYILPQKNKLMWTVADHQTEATVIYVTDTLLPYLPASMSVNIKSRLKKKLKATNIMACVPGTVTDSIIAFTAHYDHLGMMGKKTIFPGASDNASGTAMLLYLAQYYAQHPQPYTMVFVAFSGEEAGLLGSAHFVQHPPLALERIKMLTNLDIMGDATDGITVVNATVYAKEYELLTQLNEEHKYLPAVISRGKAANSDHYYFSEAGVPSFFIYSNGGKGYYHDIYDKPAEVRLTHIPGVAELLIKFAAAVQQL